MIGLRKPAETAASDYGSAVITILKKIKPHFPWRVGSPLILYLLFSYIYVNRVVPVFGMMTLNPTNFEVLGIFLILLTSFLLPQKVKLPSDLYNWLFFIILLIPAAVLTAKQGNNPFHLFLMFMSLWLLIFFQKMFSPLINRRINVSPIIYRRLPYYSVFFFVVVILILLAITVKGAFNLSLEEVYKIRFEVSENMPLALRYLVQLAASSLIGYLSALTCQRKSKKGMFLIAILGIMFFGYSSHKAMLFNPFVAMASYFLFTVSRPHIVIMAIFAILSMAVIILPGEGANLLSSLFAFRIVFIPSQINFFYFDYFSLYPHMLWAESKISFGLVSSELPMGVMKYIGGMMTGNFEIAANTGWVANAYMNANIIGIILYAAIIGIIYSFIDYWSKIFGKQLVGAAFLIPINTLIMSADLLITLFTTGLIIPLLIFQFTTLIILMHRFNIPKEKPEASLQNG